MLSKVLCPLIPQIVSTLLFYVGKSTMHIYASLYNLRFLIFCLSFKAVLLFFYYSCVSSLHAVYFFVNLIFAFHFYSNLTRVHVSFFIIQLFSMASRALYKAFYATALQYSTVFDVQ